jgi:lipoate---protein ligase
MFCINLNTTDPFYNLAVEEFLLKNADEEFLILYVNSPSVIIGKHQSVHMEVNTKFITENQIPVIRRISGGGTVFHDYGNLNFSFLRNSESGRQVDFRKYTEPVIDFLKSLGIGASFEGKNDLKVDGLKISGNAEHVHHNRVLHHGTLLFSTSMEMLGNSLRKDKSCYTSRAVASNPASVINLKEKMSFFRDIEEFRSEMIHYFKKNYNLTSYNLSATQMEQADSISNSKYKSWEWNWAYGPEYTFIKSFEIDNIPHFCSLIIKDGIIIESAIEGSYKMKTVFRNLIGRRHMVSDLSEFFRNENILLNEAEIYNFF